MLQPRHLPHKAIKPPTPEQLIARVVPVLVGLAVVLVCILLMHGAGGWDEMLWAQQLRADISSGPWDAFFKVVTDAGLYCFYALFVGALLIGIRTRRVILRALFWRHLVAQMFGAFVTVRLLKMATGRGRPGSESPGEWTGWKFDSAWHSFPSGHSADIFTGAVILAALCAPAWLRYTIWSFAVLMGLSRIAVGAHWPSDVLTGAFIGGIAGMLTLRFWALPNEPEGLSSR